LPQNKLEIILREEVFNKKSCPPALYFGYEAESITDKSTDNLIVIKKSGSSKTNPAILNAEEISIRCDYLIAADGANSLARRTLNIPLRGEDSMHTLMNIHFTCRGLSDLLKPRPAMLYFVFNQALVAVFVAHDTENDEWVCQIPIFPPFRNPEVSKLLASGYVLINLSPLSSLALHFISIIRILTTKPFSAC
jgi:2-polyprenyl-6-methoxyphenol hydroxylase-like FAD-dependent oxidoreductase